MTGLNILSKIMASVARNYFFQPMKFFKIFFENDLIDFIRLVDSEGNNVVTDFPEQADMCEIVRALISGG